MPAATAAAEPTTSRRACATGHADFRLARMEIGEFGRHRLADDDRAGLAQQPDGGGIRGRTAS